MRILAVSHPCVTDVNQQFYAELEAMGHEVHLIVPSNFRTEYSSTATKVVRWPTFQGTIEERRVGLSKSIPLHFYQSSLKKSIEKYRPEIMFVEEEPYSTSAFQAFYASRHLPMKRVIYSAQNIVKQYPPPFRAMEQYVLSHSDMAAVVSQEVGDVLRRKGFGGELLPFPLGVDTGQFRPLPEERSQIRQRLGAENTFIIGYVGRFVEEKGMATLIEALPFLPSRDFKLVMVGNGPLLGELRKAQEQYPELLHIADNVNHREVHKWMNAMDVLVLPSLTMPNWKEQFGRVIIEAMACRVPVLGSDSGEIPVLIGRTGGGWTFPEGDSDAFVRELYRISKDQEDRHSRAESGYVDVQARFSKRALAQSFIHTIQSLNESSERLVR
jgi:glycosyltransferase involved in cell wall biosynthesis